MFFKSKRPMQRRTAVAAPNAGIERLEDRTLFATFNVTPNPDANPFLTTPIQNAVNLAVATPGPDTIIVAPGIYRESVVIPATETDLRILGPKASTVASFTSRTGTPGGTNAATLGEAVLDGTTGSNLLAGPGFTVLADRVTIAGFYIRKYVGQGNGPLGTGSGIYTSPLASGYTLRNNVLRDNSIGVYFNASGVQYSQIVGSRFERNNARFGVASAAGNGVYSDQGLQGADIEFSAFTGHRNAGVIVIGAPGAPVAPATGQARAVDVHHNQSRNDTNAFALFFGVVQGRITDNTVDITGFNEGGAIVIGGGNRNITVQSNRITGGVESGVLVAPFFGANAGINIFSNTITGRTYGVWLRGPEDGEFQVVGNRIINSRRFGILVGDVPNGGPDLVRNQGNPTGSMISRNNVSGTPLTFQYQISPGLFQQVNGFDIFDAADTPGFGTSNTGNFYHANTGRGNRPGLGSSTGPVLV